jgi:hypothetical protein
MGGVAPLLWGLHMVAPLHFLPDTASMVLLNKTTTSRGGRASTGSPSGATIFAVHHKDSAQVCSGSETEVTRVICDV